jgi:hypothetical protein
MVNLYFLNDIIFFIIYVYMDYFLSFKSSDFFYTLYLYELFFKFLNVR